MKRKLTAVLAAVGVIFAVFTAAAPSAFAYRDTGWWGLSCPAGAYTIQVTERVQWYATDNHRHIDVGVYMTVGSDPTRYVANYYSVQVKAVGGDWVEYGSLHSPDVNTDYYYDRTPGLNPQDGHYWLARGNGNGVNCDLILTN